MPTVNVPPLARFILYIVGALALLAIGYFVDKDWAGDAEVRLVTGVCALLNLLAAAKTNLADSGDPSTPVGKAVADALRTNSAGGRGSRGAGSLRLIVAVVGIFVLVVILVRVL